MAPTAFIRRAESELVDGWVPQPDGRGTIDILQNCLISIFLCSWSALFLNVPKDELGALRSIMYKLRWMAFIIAFPEMVTGMAAEQWRSACQSVEDFAQLEKKWDAGCISPRSCEPASNLDRLRSSPWTMRHAFFADMGGLMLVCPDVRPFPIDAQQLLYMIENHQLEYPEISERTIWDKNKADGFARALTLIQITWFLVESIGRVAQRLDLTSLELSTLGFIFCTLNTFFFWRHKPLDVVTPIMLPCSVELKEVVHEMITTSIREYAETPLDLLKPPAARRSLVAPFWVGLKVVFDWHERKRDLPIRSFENNRTTPPRGATGSDMVFGLSFIFTYFGIHLAAWNFVFPSRTEQVLWRVSSLTLMALLVIYLLAIVLGTTMASWMARRFFNDAETDTIPGLARMLSRRVGFLTHSPVIIAYAVARTYIIVEGFFGLRTLTVTAFNTVEWTKFVQDG